LDAIICAVHGTGGEDGAILGALEYTGIPYAGGGVSAAAVSMNKQMAKAIFQSVGIPTNPGIVVSRAEFVRSSSSVIERVAAETGAVCFVKPMSLGSSIGVSRCTSEAELRDGLDLAFELDRSALVEPEVQKAIEVNCAVAGRADGQLQASACEQPLIPEGSELLGFEEKYVSGGKGKISGAKDSGMAGQERIIPAPISDALTAEVQELAKRAHRALGFSGIARYDFFIKDPEGKAEVLLNEANTVPGSFSFYLFEPVGVDFVDLGELLLDTAFAEATERRLTTTIFESVLLQDRTSSAPS
jgi:D-alanine-D-alanine ligase